MPSTIMFKRTALPRGTDISLSHGNQIVLTPPNEATLHITFHATRATNIGGQITLSYNANAWYHVSVRDGVYFARKYQNGKWEDDAANTKGNYESDKKYAKEYSLDIEQVLAVS